MTRIHTLVMNLDTGRPCCVLLQACLGGDGSLSTVFHDGRLWETSPGQRLRKVAGTAEELRQFHAAVSSGAVKL